jgi:hypothetical protein
VFILERRKCHESKEKVFLTSFLFDIPIMLTGWCAGSISGKYPTRGTILRPLPVFNRFVVRVTADFEKWTLNVINKTGRKCQPNPESIGGADSHLSRITV